MRGVSCMIFVSWVCCLACIMISLPRCEWKAKTQQKSRVEPLRLMVHGLPGAGKSEVIKWARSFFEKVLGWRHGREFVCIASMNTMAALIGGMTIHGFGGVPFNSDNAQQQARITHSSYSIIRIWVCICNTYIFRNSCSIG